jgi:integrase
MTLMSLDTEEQKNHYSLVSFQHAGYLMGNRAIGETTPNTVNSSVRTREYLTKAEIERLMAAARKSSRYGHRDATMILIGYRHGLRASELCDLQWSQVELAAGRLHVHRVKHGSPSVHPLKGDEIRALRRLQRDQGHSSHVFMTERGGPMTPKAFHALFGRIGERAKMPFPIHPHMLRHGCGYALANAGHDTRALQAYLGHKNIQHTVRYTELSPTRFKDFWRD